MPDLLPAPQPQIPIAGSGWDAFPVAQDNAPVSQDSAWDAFPEVKKPSVAVDVLKSTGSGFGKGVVGLAGLPGDFRELINSGFEKLHDYTANKLGIPPEQAAAMKQDVQDALSRARSVRPDFPTSGEIQKGVEQYTGPFYEPQTRPGKYAHQVGEFVPGAMAGGEGVVGNVLKFAVAPGIASEFAGEQTAGTPLEPYARPTAAIATGTGMGMLFRPATSERVIRSQLPDYITDAHISRAEQLVKYADSKGVQLTWPEALSRVTGKPVLTDMQRILESSPTSRTGMQDFMGARPKQVEGAARNAVDEISPQSTQPAQLGEDLSKSAQGTIKDVRGAINRTAQPFYDKSATVQLTLPEMQQVQKIPGYAAARDAIRNDPQLNRNVANLPENSVGFLNEVKKYLDQQGKNATAPFQQNANAQRAAGLNQDAATVKRAAVGASTDYATALAVESVAREKYLNPLLNGPLGRIADEPKTKAVIDALFPQTPLAGSQKEITKAVGALSQRSPQATQMLVRTYLESAFNEATRDLQSGPNTFGGAKFAVRIAGNSQQRANLKAAVDALPGGAGKYEGFEKFLDVLEATGTRQPIGSKTSFNTQELAMMKTGSVPAEILKTGGSPGTWMSLAKDKIGNWQIGKNLDELSAIITEPKSADLLRKIARLPTASREAQVIALRMVAQNSAAKSRDSGGQQ